jgi:hypothetical protein
MNIQASKLNIIEKLMSVNKESLLFKIETILEEEAIVAYTVSGKPLTKKEYNKRLEIAEQQILSGDVIPQEDLEKEVEKW